MVYFEKLPRAIDTSATTLRNKGQGIHSLFIVVVVQLHLTKIKIWVWQAEESRQQQKQLF